MAQQNYLRIPLVPICAICPAKLNLFSHSDLPIHLVLVINYAANNLGNIRSNEQSRNKVTKTKQKNSVRPRANYIDRETAAMAMLMPNFADRGCHVVSVTDP
jgi:hypothetical protein